MTQSQRYLLKLCKIHKTPKMKNYLKLSDVINHARRTRTKAAYIVAINMLGFVQDEAYNLLFLELQTAYKKAR